MTLAGLHGAKKSKDACRHRYRNHEAHARLQELYRRRASTRMCSHFHEFQPEPQIPSQSRSTAFPSLPRGDSSQRRCCLGWPGLQAFRSPCQRELLTNLSGSRIDVSHELLPGERVEGFAAAVQAMLGSQRRVSGNVQSNTAHPLALGGTLSVGTLASSAIRDSSQLLSALADGARDTSRAPIRACSNEATPRASVSSCTARF